MKKIIKIISTVFGISAICYLVAREKVLIKKIAHDCDKIKMKFQILCLKIRNKKVDRIFYFYYIINIDRSIDDMMVCLKKVKMVFGVDYGYSRDV